MPRSVIKILYVLAGAVTLLAIYLVIKYVVPEAFSLLSYLLVILLPFLLAVFFCIFMEPLVIFLGHNGRVPRAVTVPVAMLIFFGGIGTVLTLIFLRLIKELSDLSATIPQMAVDAQNFIDLWVKKGVSFYGTLPKSVTSSFQESLNNIIGTVEHWAGELVGILIAIVSGVPGAFMVILVSLVATFFFSRDREKIARLWLRVVPQPWGMRIMEISKEIAVAFQAYVRAQIILVSITAFISIIGLYLIGTKYALTVGLLIGFLDMIPVLGPGTIYVPWVFLAFVTGNTVLGIELTVLYLVIMIIRGMLEAKVVASNLGLHPLAVLVAMFVGLKTIGVIGLILGPILIVAILSAFKAGSFVNK